MSITLFVALLTLAPLVFGLLIYLAAKAHLARARVVLALATLGALIPIVGLPFFMPGVSYGQPITIRPFGTGSGFGLWIAPTYRLDTFALYVAIGVAYLVVPVLLWLAFQERANERLKAEDTVYEGTASLAPMPDSGAPIDTAGEPPASNNGSGNGNGHDVPADAPEQTDAPALASPAATARIALRSDQGVVAPELYRTAALVLVLETFALSAILADGIVLLGVAWILLAATAWAIGETASDRTTLDRLGVLLTCVGPLLWLIIMIFPARAAGAMRLLDLTGRTAVNTFQVILLAVALALAGGAYPFMVWVRRRAAFATPAGLGALALVVAPAALYVGLRTYTVTVVGAAHWPLFSAPPTQPTTPAPINAGIAFVVLGTATVVAAGLLALARRDARALVALLVCAQIGWGLVGIGTGVPISVYAVVVLLATGALGLGAMLAALSAGGVITIDLEPTAEGPHAVGDATRPLALAAWCIGAFSLVGAPLLPGFIPRHLISVGTLQIQGLGVPLIGLCWVGDALLALALLRAVAPALVSRGADPEGRDGREFLVGIRDLPAVVLAVLALVAGIAPALLLGVFSGVAAAPVVGQDTVGGLVFTSALGYGTGGGQWAVGVAWLAMVVVGLLVLIVRPGATRGTAPVFTAGHASTAGADADLDEDEAQDRLLPDPALAWADLRPAITSAWTLPGSTWLLSGADEDDDGSEPAPNGEPEDAQAVGATASASTEDAPDGDD